MLGTGANSTIGAHSPPGNRRRIWPDPKSTFQRDPGFVRTQLLPQAGGLDQHILWITKLLLPLDRVAVITVITPLGRNRKQNLYRLGVNWLGQEETSAAVP